MIVSKQKLTIILVVFCIIITDGLFSCLMASNQIFNMQFKENDRVLVLSLTLAERPEFALRPVQDNRILLSLFNIVKAGEFDQISSRAANLELQEDPKNNQIKFRIDPKKSFEKIGWVWIENNKTFRIFLNLSENNNVRAYGPDVMPVLNNIIFGFKEKATRMVMALDRNPSWEIRYSEPTNILLSLISSSADIEDKRYESKKWLKDITVKKISDVDTDISLNLKTALNRVSLFWMDMGNRLVMDLYSDPSGILGELASQVNDRTGKEKNNANGDGQHLLLKDGVKAVRMRIPEKTLPESDRSEENEKNTVAEIDSPLIIKPRLDNSVPGVEDIKVSVQDLDPEEAFLFGRVQQAMEINDFEMGVTLINQFLSEFPQSELIETLCFWRGDFYYFLWKMGDKDAGQKVIPAYQYAVERFSKSEKAPWAYIKMAQAGSLLENSFQSLGYLSIVLSKKKGPFIPLAYLTRGKIFLSMEKPEKAIADFKILLDKFAKSPYAAEANFWIASYYHEMGLYEEAEKNLKEIADSNPDLYLVYPEYLLLRAKNYLYLKDYDSAREYLFKAVNIGGQKESIDLLLSRIGDTYHNQENEKEAEKYYRMVIDYYPESEGASISKLRLADYFSDITILEDLSEENNNEPIGDLAVLEKGYQLFENKQFADTIESLEELVKKPIETETRKDARRLYINATEKEIKRLYEAGLYRELIDLFSPRKAMMNDIIEPDILLLTAEAYGKIGLYQDAIAIYRQIKPYDLSREEKGNYYQGLVNYYMADDDKQSAVQLLEKIKEDGLESNDMQRLNLIQANIYKDKGREEEAYGLYETVINNKGNLLNNEIAEAYLNVGIILKNKRNYTGARMALNKSITLSLKDESDFDILQPAYKELGDVFRLEGKYNKAVKAYEKGFALGYGVDNPDYWETRFRLALTYIDLGENVKAEAVLNEISEEGDTILQQRAEIKLGSLDLEKQLRFLSISKN
jgi:FimV-like protein